MLQCSAAFTGSVAGTLQLSLLLVLVVRILPRPANGIRKKETVRNKIK